MEIHKISWTQLSAERYEWESLAERHMHNMSDQLFVAFEKYFLTSNEVSLTGLFVVKIACDDQKVRKMYCKQFVIE